MKDCKHELCNRVRETEGDGMCAYPAEYYNRFLKDPMPYARVVA